MKSIKEFIKALIYGPNGPSLTSTMAVTSYLFFIIVTIYLLLTAKSWAHYEVFAAITAGGGLATQTAGKLINNRYAQSTESQGGLNNVR